MKYTDRQTLILKKKQLDKQMNEFEYRDRTNIRKRKSNLKKFGVKVCRYVDRIWWASLDESKRDKAFDEWYHISFINRRAVFKDWILKFQKDEKPNTSLYRENRINEILK